MTDVVAKLHYLRMAPRKVRLVANLVRGMEISQARTELDRMPKRASAPLRKLLLSCMANAKHNFNLDEQKLYISELRVDGGPMLKRTFPRSRGRADIKRKRMSHVTLVLREKDHGKEN